MEYRKLGRTGLKVSELCLGTMQWGWTADEAAAFAVMDAFVEAGGNFIDTADVYSRWAPGNPGGVSEEIIGRWMQARGNRRQIVLATKVRGRMWDGANGEGSAACTSWPRSRTACAVCRPIPSTCPDPLVRRRHADRRDMRALDDLVRQGKVRYLGCVELPGLAADQGPVDQRHPRPGALRTPSSRTTAWPTAPSSSASSRNCARPRASA